MSTIHLTASEMVEHALAISTAKQRDALVKLQANGFRIYRTKSEGSTSCVLVTHPNTFGIVYPDGSLHRALKGKKTVTIDWSRAHALRATEK